MSTHAMITVTPPKWGSMPPEMIARAVAFVLRRLEGVCMAVTATATGLLVEVTVKDDGSLGDAMDLENQVIAILESDVTACPCGCGADMTIANCRKDDPHWPMLVDGLNPTEIEAVTKGNKILAIKLVRERVGIGLAEAKNLVDRYLVKHSPNPYAARGKEAIFLPCPVCGMPYQAPRMSCPTCGSSLR